VSTLPVLEGPLGCGAEHPVGGNSDGFLQCAHATPGATGGAPRTVPSAMPARAGGPLPLENGPGAEAERAPGQRPGHTVRGEAVAALPTLEGALGGGAEDPVDGDSEGPLQGADAAPGAGRPGGTCA
jgi:hypothetical protein